MKTFFILATLFVLIACTAIALPNYLSARNRQRQKRSMSDLRHLAVALMEYEKDNSEYPQVGIGSLEALLAPEYLGSATTIDAWGNPFEYASNGSTFELRSWGSDGRKEALPGGDKQHGFKFDLIIRDGSFWQFPHGH